MKQKSKTCELCTNPATVYCAADTAYLCTTCDSSVHSANFLVARHVRWTRCSTCGCALLLSGPGSDPIRHVCRSCSPDPVSPCCESDASSCVLDREERKKEESKKKKRRRGREGEELLVVLGRARARRRGEKEGWAETD